MENFKQMTDADFAEFYDAVRNEKRERDALRAKATPLANAFFDLESDGIPIVLMNMSTGEQIDVDRVSTLTMQNRKIFVNFYEKGD